MFHRCVLLITLLPSVAFGQLDYEREPISYSQTEPVDQVHQLADRIVSGQSALTWEKDHGYLKSLLRELGIDVSTQTLVFSKTSLQVGRISPRTPRAIYFNDDVYVGWVPRGDIIEVSAADPALGATFYALSQKPSDQPLLKRETSRCLQCHGSTHTRRVPGHIVRSVYPDQNGQPIFRLGTHHSDHTSPFRERFGGWYVTGTHGNERHMGNQWLKDPDNSEELELDAGANVTDLSASLNLSRYLSPHSDIVALMVLQHQVHMHNVLTAANHSGRLTMRDATIMNRALERNEDHESESTRRRFESAAEKVVKALLFCDEFALTSAVTGTSEFQTKFERQGPFDKSGRSLRQFDLQQRLFAYPCSFLIYSDACRALPNKILSRIYQRLDDILSGQDMSDTYAHLTAADRAAIKQILEQTGICLPADAD